MRTPVIIVAIALGTFACKQYGEGRYPAASAEAQPAEQVVDNPPYGERVTVKGDVDDVYGPQIFTMHSGLLHEDLLVYTPEGVTVSDPDEVEVVGTMRKMVIAEFEREFEIDLDNAVEVEWEGRPLLVAEAITRLPDEPLMPGMGKDPQEQQQERMEERTDQQEQQAEERADQMEEQAEDRADQMEQQAEDRADQMKERADQAEERADRND